MLLKFYTNKIDMTSFWIMYATDKKKYYALQNENSPPVCNNNTEPSSGHMKICSKCATRHQVLRAGGGDLEHWGPHWVSVIQFGVVEDAIRSSLSIRPAVHRHCGFIDLGAN